MLLVGTMFSCQKDDTTKGDEENLTGEMSITFGYAGTETKADASTYKVPKTLPWVAQEEVLLLRLQNNGTTTGAFANETRIVGAYIIHVGGGGASSTTEIAGVEVVATPSRWVAIRNYQTVATATSGVGVNSQRALSGIDNPLGLIGKTLNEVKFALKNHTQAGLLTNVFSPTDIFIGHAIESRPTSVSENGTVAIAMSRAVSLIRTKLIVNPSGTDATTHQNTTKINWESTKNYISIRKATETISVSGALVSYTDKTIGVVHSGKFMDAEPNTTDYTGGSDILTKAAGSTYPTNFLAWQDFAVFPNNGKDKFNIVIAMEVEDGYVAVNPTTGQKVDMLAGDMVYWTGQVSELISAAILEITAELNRAGSTDLDNPKEYGNLDVLVNLKPWATVVSTVVPM